MEAAVTEIKKSTPVKICSIDLWMTVLCGRIEYYVQFSVTLKFRQTGWLPSYLTHPLSNCLCSNIIGFVFVKDNRNTNSAS
jgi:hypothetical protein